MLAPFLTAAEDGQGAGSFLRNMTSRPTPTKAPVLSRQESDKMETFNGRPWTLSISQGGIACDTPATTIQGTGAQSLYHFATHAMGRSMDLYSFEQLSALPESFLEDVIQATKETDGYALGLWWLEMRLKIARGEMVHSKRLEIVDLNALLKRAACGDDTLPIRAMNGPGLGVVTTLHLHRCKSLDDRSCLALRDLPNLTILYTTYCPIGDFGIRSLGSAIDVDRGVGLLNLKAWWLDGCGGVTDKGVKAFASFPALELINLTNTSATDAAFFLLGREGYRWEPSSAPALPYSPDTAHAQHIVIVAEHAENIVRLLTNSRPPHLAVFGLERRNFTRCSDGLPQSPFLFMPSGHRQHLRNANHRISILLDWSRSAAVDEYWWQPQQFNADPGEWVYRAQGKPLTLRRKGKRLEMSAKLAKAPASAGPKTVVRDVVEDMISSVSRNPTSPRRPATETSATTHKRRKMTNPFAKTK